MPKKAPAICHCGAVRVNGKCPRCAPAYRKPERTRFYGTRKWRRIADEFRAMKQGICDACGGPGATHVDHIVPRADGGTDDPSNLQLLHEHCHSRKTIGENRRRGVM